MAIFLRQSHNIKPPIWGSPADVQYAIQKNAEKIYSIDPDSIVLAMPLFWGLPCLDYSGKNNHGTNYGCVWKDGGLFFDGINDYISILDVSYTNKLSVFARTKADSLVTASEHMVSEHPGWFLTRRSANSKARFCINSGSEVGVYANDVLDNAQHQYYGVYNGATVKIYVDGLLNDTQNQTGNIDTTGSTRIGAYHGNTSSASFNWHGLIDEVRISNVARTADQIVLFHDRPWALYQPVSRPVWSIPAGAEHTKNLSDTINITDARIANFGLNKADSMSLSDSISKGLGLNKADSITLSDSIAKAFSFSKADSIALSDGIIKAFGLNKGDTINLSDAISSKAFGLNKADTISLSDSIAKKTSFSKADTINLSDSIIKKPGLNKADTINLSDSISSKGFGLNKADSIALSDNIAKSFSFSKADTINMSDEISTLLTLLKTLSDTINMSDSISSKTFGLNKADIISLSDNVAKEFGLNKADTINMTDEAIKAFGLSLSDNISLSDSLDSAVLSALAALYNFLAKNKTFNFNAKNTTFNFNAKPKTFNFNARTGG